MLTLERKEGETITIVHDSKVIEVTIKEVLDGKAKLSFDGPKEFQIFRGTLSDNFSKN